MVTTITRGSNHYEALGLTPAASPDDIKRAFARRMGMFLPITQSAQIGAAYETLRDPIKRKAYNKSLGIEPEQRPRYSATGMSFSIPAHSTNSAPRPPALHAGKSDLRSGSAAQASPQATPPHSGEPRVARFIAASLRSPPSATTEAGSSVAHSGQPNRAKDADKSRREPPIDSRQLPGVVETQGLQWKGPVAIAGALVATVALFAGWAGWDAGHDVDAQAAGAGVTVAVPAPKAVETAAAPSPSAVADPQPSYRAPAKPVARLTERVPAARIRAVVKDETAVTAPAQPRSTDTAPSVAADAAATDAPGSVGSAPLPNATIARTIGRIGYACGSVASVTAISGAGGAYKVTCASGDSYRAAPIRGRYHFRRWTGH